VPCLALLAASCASQPLPKPQTAAAPALPPPRVEKFREPLEVTPLELHFSGIRGETRSSEAVAVKNTSAEAVQISDLRVVGQNAATFKILNAPLLPLILGPGLSISFSVGFEPAADAEPGVHHARVRTLRGEDDDGPPCDLTGLVTKGKARADEPPLQQVLESLGYEIDVGSPALKLPPGPAGDEIAARNFVRAKAGTVGYYLIARYTEAEDSSFGTYVLDKGKPVTREMGMAGKAHAQTLNPELEGESQTSFDAGDGPFGIYLSAGKRTLYADEAVSRQKAARVYPLRSRGRTLVQDAYIVAFDEDGDGDFQDHVFMLWNVKPAP
jgi:hypothetical protein